MVPDPGLLPNFIHHPLLIIVKQTKVLEYFGPERSLLVHLGSLWKAAVDIICGYFCRCLHEKYPNNWANAATALTHPEILHSSETFESAIGVGLFFDPGVEMDEIQNYLRDRERAGRYFVDGGMYAALCLHLCNVVRLASDTL